MMASDEQQHEPPVLVHARWGREHHALYDAYRMLCDTHAGQLVRVKFMVSHMTSKVDRFTADDRMRQSPRVPRTDRRRVPHLRTAAPMLISLCRVSKRSETSETWQLL